jgi:hypothetical protein
MATTITWVISALDCIPNTPEGADYVVTAHWSCNGTDGTYNGSVYSTCSFPVVQGTSFVPYAQLTENEVLGWCWANGVDKAATEAAVEQQIQNQITPPIVTPPLPWAAPVTA